MDSQTLEAYAQHAPEWIARDGDRESPLQHLFSVAFGTLRPGRAVRVLDVGAGRGRELLALQRMGFDAWGIEPSAALRAATRPGLVHPLMEGSLPDALPSSWPFDGVVCSAVLQHIPRGQLFESVLALRDCLVPGGRALVSIPRGPRPDVDADGRDPWGRLFNNVGVDEFLLLFERVGFTFLTRSDNDDAWGRPGVAWATLLFERPALSGNTRPIDQLASVLGKGEKKYATYKLALLRALNDLAATQPHVARWREDGRVAIPANAIAELWIRYYWPLLSGPLFVPQMQGDQRERQHTFKFASELIHLIEAYRGRNGLDGFEIACVEGSLGSSASLHKTTLQKIRQAIRSGPVVHAGRGSSDGPIFEWDRDQVLVSRLLWREFSLLNHWIGDSLILRWAELIHSLSAKQVGVEQSVALLLPKTSVWLTARHTGPVADIYKNLQTARCVWSGKRIPEGELAIDHVIPWALWRNNDLWNLVPTLASINQKKSDQLPSRRLLRARTSAIKDTWGVSLERWPDRFRREAQRHIPGSVTSTALVDALFDSLVESVETLRLQRGLEVWDGPGSRAA